MFWPKVGPLKTWFCLGMDPQIQNMGNPATQMDCMVLRMCLDVPVSPQTPPNPSFWAISQFSGIFGQGPWPSPSGPLWANRAYFPCLGSCAWVIKVCPLEAKGNTYFWRGLGAEATPGCRALWEGPDSHPPFSDTGCTPPPGGKWQPHTGQGWHTPPCVQSSGCVA